jgi:hypothetical protein
MRSPAQKVMVPHPKPTTPAATTATMNYDDILTFCRDTTPALIYVGIGCAQLYRAPGTIANQQCPPFVLARWTTSPRVCILIDPALESPPAIYEDLGIEGTETATAPIVQRDTLTFIPLRQLFHWGAAAETALIHGLCQLAVDTPQVHLIVQDYSGIDYRVNYPLHLFSPTLTHKVVFDITHSDDGSCGVDFDRVELPLAPDDGFIQLSFSPVNPLCFFYSDRLVAEEMRRRADTIIYYAHRHYVTQRDIPEPGAWSSNAEVHSRIRNLAIAYRTPHAVSPPALKQLTTKLLRDFAAAAEETMTEEQAVALVDGPEREVTLTLRRLTALVSIRGRIDHTHT